MRIEEFATIDSNHGLLTNCMEKFGSFNEKSLLFQVFPAHTELQQSLNAILEIGFNRLDQFG